MHRDKKVTKVTCVGQLFNILKLDANIQDVVYLFQHGKFIYLPDFHGSPLEKQIDITLYYLSYICYLKYKKIISDDEFNFFQIIISRALKSKELKDYLCDLYHYECYFGKYDPKSKKGIDNYTFTHLLRYGKETGEIKEILFKKDGPHKHYLNY